MAEVILNIDGMNEFTAAFKIVHITHDPAGWHVQMFRGFAIGDRLMTKYHERLIDALQEAGEMFEEWKATGKATTKESDCMTRYNYPVGREHMGGIPVE